MFQLVDSHVARGGVYTFYDGKGSDSGYTGAYVRRSHDCPANSPLRGFSMINHLTAYKFDGQRVLIKAVGGSQVELETLSFFVDQFMFHLDMTGDIHEAALALEFNEGVHVSFPSDDSIFKMVRINA